MIAESGCVDELEIEKRARKSLLYGEIELELEWQLLNFSYGRRKGSKNVTAVARKELL